MEGRKRGGGGELGRRKKMRLGRKEWREGLHEGKDESDEGRNGGT